MKSNMLPLYSCLLCVAALATISSAQQPTPERLARQRRQHQAQQQWRHAANQQQQAQAGAWKKLKPMARSPDVFVPNEWTWGMVSPSGQATAGQRPTGSPGALRPNPVVSPELLKFDFFPTKARNGTATNNLPGASNFRPGKVRLPSTFKNRQPYNRRPTPGGNPITNKKPSGKNGMVPDKAPPKRVPGTQAKAHAAGKAGTGLDSGQASKADGQSPVAADAPQQGQEYVKNAADSAQNAKRTGSSHPGTIDVLGSIPAGRHYQTFIDVQDGGNFSIVFAVCSGRLEIDVSVNQESLFDYSNMQRRRRQTHGLQLRYETPFARNSGPDLGSNAEQVALGTLTQLNVDPGRYYLTVINEATKNIGRFGLYATHHLDSMIYPILPEEPMIRVSAIRPTQILVSWPPTLDAGRNRIEYCVMTTESATWKHRVVTNACDKFLAEKSSSAPVREKICTTETEIMLKRLRPATAYHVEVDARNLDTDRYVPYLPTVAVTSEAGVTLEDAVELRDAAVDGYSKRVFTFDVTRRVARRGPLSVTVASCNALHGWLLTRDGVHVAQRGPPGEGGAPAEATSRRQLMVSDAAMLHALQRTPNASHPAPYLQQSSHETLDAERGVYQLTVYNHGPQAMKADIFATTSLAEKPFPTTPTDAGIFVQNASCDAAVLNWHEGLGSTNVTYCLQLTVGYEPSLVNSLDSCNSESSYSVIYDDMLLGADCSPETEREVSLAARHHRGNNATADPAITAEVIAVNTHTRRLVVYPPSTFMCNTSGNTLALLSASAGHLNPAAAMATALIINLAMLL
ncbi:uncharacterized protein LOC135828445 [Sycon ciliatum]|uniref:uncharacterized protein LOC135828445 n=1 Tax=Sycon ciliatum TaxID=27933 RepID=UPI0031F69EAF